MRRANTFDYRRFLIREIYSQKKISNERCSRSIFSIHGREVENILFPRMDTRRVIIKRTAVSIYPTCARLFLCKGGGNLGPPQQRIRASGNAIGTWRMGSLWNERLRLEARRLKKKVKRENEKKRKFQRCRMEDRISIDEVENFCNEFQTNSTNNSDQRPITLSSSPRSITLRKLSRHGMPSRGSTLIFVGVFAFSRSWYGEETWERLTGRDLFHVKPLQSVSNGFLSFQRVYIFRTEGLQKRERNNENGWIWIYTIEMYTRLGCLILILWIKEFNQFDKVIIRSN